MLASTKRTLRMRWRAGDAGRARDLGVGEVDADDAAGSPTASPAQNASVPDPEPRSRTRSPGSSPARSRWKPTPANDQRGVRDRVQERLRVAEPEREAPAGLVPRRMRIESDLAYMSCTRCSSSSRSTSVDASAWGRLTGSPPRPRCTSPGSRSRRCCRRGDPSCARSSRSCSNASRTVLERAKAFASARTRCGRRGRSPRPREAECEGPLLDLASEAIESSNSPCRCDSVPHSIGDCTPAGGGTWAATVRKSCR